MISIPFVNVIIIYFQQIEIYEFYKQNFPKNRCKYMFEKLQHKTLK